MNKIFLIGILFIIGCNIPMDDYHKKFRSKEGCFNSGGIEWQHGESGSSTHDVCIYKKE